MMKTKDLESIIIDYTKTIITSELNPLGISGVNGPYNDPETPVRNVSHHLNLLSYFYQRYRNEDVKKIAYQAIDFLLGSESRPYDKSFHHRNKKGKDYCNGLVGQAWAIESLVIASEVFERKDCYDLAEKVYKLHPFEDTVGVWRRIEIDGTILSPDPVFNHQLWFAAAASMLSNTPQAQSDVETFLTKTVKNIKTYKNGVIYHSSPVGFFFSNAKLGIFIFLRELWKRLKKNLVPYKERLYLKSVGYHGFNLYALSILKQKFPESSVWQQDFMSTIFSVCESSDFKKDLLSSPYGYYYNLSGLEIAYAYEIFFEDRIKANEWIQRQFYFTWENSSNPLGNGAFDQNTAKARLYEATRLNHDYIIKTN